MTKVADANRPRQKHGFYKMFFKRFRKHKAAKVGTNNQCTPETSPAENFYLLFPNAFFLREILFVQNNIDECRKLLSHCLVVNVVTSVVLFLLLFIISPVIRFIHQPSDVVDLAIPFLNVMMLGMIPLAIFTSFKQFAEGLSFTRFAMIITVGTNLLNILFNYMLIYGKFGFSAMGMAGFKTILGNFLGVRVS